MARHRAGFTLIELLLVVAILATIAGAVLSTMEGVQERAQDEVTTHELGQLRDALLAFKRDLGCFPNQGAFAQPTPDEEDLSQLLATTWPLAPTVPPNPLATWDPDRRRGWRGPYLRAVRVDDRALPKKVLDPSGRPYVLDLDAPDGPRILSHGPSLDLTTDDQWFVLQ
jgi:prepilin-type N-terminal cleavage/methylation domain-containing protein